MTAGRLLSQVGVRAPRGTRIPRCQCVTTAVSGESRQVGGKYERLVRWRARTPTSVPHLFLSCRKFLLSTLWPQPNRSSASLFIFLLPDGAQCLPVQSGGHPVQRPARAVVVRTDRLLVYLRFKEVYTWPQVRSLLAEARRRRRAAATRAGGRRWRQGRQSPPAKPAASKTARRKTGRRPSRRNSAALPRRRSRRRCPRKSPSKLPSRCATWRH